MEFGSKSIEVVYRKSTDARKQNVILCAQSVHYVLRAGAVHLESSAHYNNKIILKLIHTFEQCILTDV